MVFSMMILLIWGIYAFVMKKRLQDKFRFSDSLLSLVIFSIITSLSLGMNYVAAAIPSLNDGIGIHNFLAYWIIGEDNWQIALFKNYFDYSLGVSLSLLLVYSVLKVIKN
ncbi:hypothetical protein [Desulfosporosinus youngiae]|uniref:Uncharacterized protein n=1 Tax=Desulfosporosinus youngiae DSM 17734 TaxID=768710 RepID=H5Y1Z6_9FIRM|nr:hypothetical protein [Desulfosporosinus youngiae]EHQ88047.1 hypothetical protein DesyoDRAFT_0875 [Desulfosporosinus youngiae DSM 17734]